MKGHVSIVLNRPTAEPLLHVLAGLQDYGLLGNIAIAMMWSVFP